MNLKLRLIVICLLCLLSQSWAVFYHDQGYQYLNPLPESHYVSPSSTIIVRFNHITPQDIANLSQFITVTGSDGALYHGKTKIASDNKTVIFTPVTSFKPGETVQVKIAPACQGAKNGLVSPLSYRFFVSLSESLPSINKYDDPEQSLSRSENASLPKSALPLLHSSANKNSSTNSAFQSAAPGQAMVLSNGVSVPSDFPFVTITVNDNPDTGYIFLDNWNGPPYNMILDNTGWPIAYMRTPDQRRDFKVQQNGLMTMMVRQGYSLPLFGWGYIAYDQTYTEVDTFCAANGWGSDEHELQVLKDGHYLLVAIKEEPMDVSAYIDGGQHNATVRQSCLQEFTPEHEMIFQWTSLDHYDMHDLEIDNPRSNYFRFSHMNAISIDDDNNILVSNRHLSEVTKIDRQTGDIIWRLGGAHNQFTFVNDELNGFRNLHDIRALGNGHYTVFDNGNSHSPQVSRAAEYVVDTTNMTATMVWEFRDTPDKYTEWMGNTQRLPNGNTLINWADGSLPKITEVRPNGEKAFEMWFNDYMHCYRVFRCHWKGVAKAPYLIIEPHKESISVIMNKFGDPDVAYYNIYAGTSPHPATVIDSSRTTLKRLTNLTNLQNYYFRVTAVNHDNQESAFSNEESALVSFIPAGNNMVVNGDFAMQKQYWYFAAINPARATWTVNKDGVSQFKITNGNTGSWDIQFVQPNMELVRGLEYIFEFDAWSDSARTIDPVVLLAREPYTIYSKTGSVALTTRQKHYSFEFVMEDASDYNAYVVFFLGGSEGDVFLDNISLKRKMPSAVDRKPLVSPAQYQLLGNYPNPFNANTRICFAVPQQSQVKIELYNLLGQLQQTVCDQRFDTGQHEASLNGFKLSTGIYFCRMVAIQDKQIMYNAVHKILLVK